MLLTVKNPVANIYKKNNRNSEIVTQILLGEHFKCQKKIGNFFKKFFEACFHRLIVSSFLKSCCLSISIINESLK